MKKTLGLVLSTLLLFAGALAWPVGTLAAAPASPANAAVSSAPAAAPERLPWRQALKDELQKLWELRVEG